MASFLIRRFLLSMFVMWFATVVVFSLSRAAGDPRYLFVSEYSTQEQWDEWGVRFGLDRPYPMQYLIWLGKAVRFNFGESIYFNDEPKEIIGERWVATAQLSFGAYLFAMIVGVPLGVWSAIARGSVLDLVARGVALIGQAMPGFWLGIMLILLFSVQLNLLPTSGIGGWKHYVLPAITLGWFPAAGILRLIRSSMLDTLDSEYIKFARAKGVSSRKIIWKHALRNSAIVPMTYAGVLLAFFITGAVVTETVFFWPGLGRLSVQAVFNTDFPMLGALVLLFTATFLIVNLAIDLLYRVIDPRIRIT